MKSATQLPHPDREDFQLGQVLFALSDPGRLAIVRELAGGPQEAAQCLPSAPEMPKTTKSHMMKVLREAGVIRNAPHGRNRLLSLRREDLDARFPGLLDAVLKAEAEVPAGGSRDRHQA
jgi:DNA-binding transcriptional ArsR family regulator